MLFWPDFDIMSFGYSMNMYLCILGLAFFTAGLFLAQVPFYKTYFRHESPENVFLPKKTDGRIEISISTLPFFPGIDGLPLPPPPALGVKVLDSWKYQQSPDSKRPSE